MKSLRCLSIVLTLGALAACDVAPLSTPCNVDSDCLADHLCNLASATCYPAKSSGSAVEGTAKGPFTCPLLPSGSTSNKKGNATVLLKHDGQTYALSDCSLSANKRLIKLRMLGANADATIAATLQLVLHEADHKPGALSLPAQAHGWLATAAAGKPATYQAAVWGGTLTFKSKAQNIGEDTTGELSVNVLPFNNKPLGSICRLSRTCGASCPLISPDDFFSVDCQGSVSCFPLFDGSNKGFCTKTCTSDGACTAIDKTSTCQQATSKTKLCLHRCSKSSECESPFVCKPGFCYFPTK